MVDVLGLILAVAVTGANVQDRDGCQLVLSDLKDRFARIERVWADGAYTGQVDRLDLAAVTMHVDSDRMTTNFAITQK